MSLSDAEEELDPAPGEVLEPEPLELLDEGTEWPDPDTLEWPDPKSKADKVALYQARLDARKKRIDEEIARTKSEIDADIAQAADFHSSMFAVAKDGLERSRAAAEMVQKSAGAITALYTGVLAVSFSVTDRPLPLRGVLPAFFLGAAIVLSTAYVAFIGKSGSVEAPTDDAPGRVAQLTRVRTFIAWMREGTLPRAPFLRASVVALGVGVALLPAPFLAIGETQPTAAPTHKISWPPIIAASSPESAADLEREKILYTEQVKEAGDERAKEAASAQVTRPHDGLFILLCLVVGLLFVILVARYGGKDDERRKKQNDSIPPGINATAGWLRSVAMIIWKKKA